MSMISRKYIETAKKSAIAATVFSLTLTIASVSYAALSA